MIIDLVFPWPKRENKKCNQYKHEKQGKNNIFVEFYQLVNKGVRLRSRQGMRKQRGREVWVEIFLVVYATSWYKFYCAKMWKTVPSILTKGAEGEVKYASSVVWIVSSATQEVTR